MNKFRSHNCGELSKKNDGNVVHLSGWVNKKRDHGGLLFIDFPLYVYLSGGTSRQRLGSITSISKN